MKKKQEKGKLSDVWTFVLYVLKTLSTTWLSYICICYCTRVLIGCSVLTADVVWSQNPSRFPLRNRQRISLACCFPLTLWLISTAKRQLSFQISVWWENLDQHGRWCVCWWRVKTDGAVKPHSRTDLISSTGWEGKFRASVRQQRNKIPVISSSSLLHSSQALMGCLGNVVRAAYLHVCKWVCVWVSISGGLRNHRVKIMCHQRGLGAHGFVKGLGSCCCRAWGFYSV